MNKKWSDRSEILIEVALLIELFLGPPQIRQRAHQFRQVAL